MGFPPRVPRGEPSTAVALRAVSDCFHRARHLAHLARWLQRRNPQRPPVVRHRHLGRVRLDARHAPLFRLARPDCLHTSPLCIAGTRRRHRALRRFAHPRRGLPHRLPSGRPRRKTRTHPRGHRQQGGRRHLCRGHPTDHRIQVCGVPQSLDEQRQPPHGHPATPPRRQKTRPVAQARRRRRELDA